MKEFVKNLRKNQTEAETRLWAILRSRRFCHIKFRRQRIIGSYIVDFVCLKHRLIVELDGSQHLVDQAYDTTRTYFLNSKGFKVLRFWNDQVLREQEVVLNAIFLELTNNPHPVLRTTFSHLGRREDHYKFVPD